MKKKPVVATVQRSVVLEMGAIFALLITVTTMICYRVIIVMGTCAVNTLYVMKVMQSVEIVDVMEIY